MKNEIKSLYIHFPFCLSKCSYCDFVSGFKVDEEVIHRYINGLCKEIQILSHETCFIKPVLETIYIGGGTPSLLSESHLEKLFSTLKEYYQIDKAEITIEANPEDITVHLAKCWKECGINRTSLGFQSMNDSILKFMKRRNSSDSNKNAFEILRQAGFNNISIDFISSISGDRIDKCLNFIKIYLPEHVSIYHLTIAENTELFNQINSRIYFPLSDEKIINIFHKCNQLMIKNGYYQYEISNFARGKGFISKHNCNYWDYGQYYGVGVAATGFKYSEEGNNFGIRTTNSDNLAEYFSYLDQFKRPVDNIETIDYSTAVKEVIMLQLRKIEGIDLTLFKKLFGKDLFQLIPRKQLEEMSEWITIDKNSIRIKLKGLDIMNTLVSQIWDLL